MPRRIIIPACGALAPALLWLAVTALSVALGYPDCPACGFMPQGAP